MRNSKPHSQIGLTLLEVLIAISMFALIGAASFRVLTGVIESQEQGDRHSVRLAAFQKAIAVIDRDLRQVVNRPVRAGPDRDLGALLVDSGEYPFEFTRIGWQNPLMLTRSNLQRVAYDIGPHPKADDAASPHFGDEKNYLRRLYWLALDRVDTEGPVVQVLLPAVDDFQVVVITRNGRHTRWPAPRVAAGAGTLFPIALEVNIGSSQLGQIKRLYPLEMH